MGRVSLSDIANKLGVSTSTVSRALRNKAGVNPHLREAIFKMAQDLNYPFPLQENATTLNQIGIVLPDISNPFFATVCYGIESVLRPSGFLSHLVNTEEDHEVEADYVRSLVQSGVKGLIVAPSADSEYIYREYASQLPIVFFDRYYEIPNTNSVLVDNLESIFHAVRHLVENGHTRICLIGGNEELYTGQARTQGFLAAVKYYNLNSRECPVFRGQFKVPEAYAATRRVLKNSECTAVVTTSNKTTLGALRAIRELGLSIPKDISLVGFDNQEWMQIYDPPITTVVQPAFSMGALAASLLLQRFSGCTPQAKVVLKADMEHRESVAELSKQVS